MPNEGVDPACAGGIMVGIVGKSKEKKANANKQNAVLSIVGGIHIKMKNLSQLLSKSFIHTVRKYVKWQDLSVRERRLAQAPHLARGHRAYDVNAAIAITASATSRARHRL
ncbi:MAG: hypothetical protein ACYS4W_06855 [Planctomycetota bacterium]